MATKSVLIIGGSGSLGTELALALRDGYKVFCTYCTHRITIPGVTFLPFNVEVRNWVKRVAYSFKPDVIIYLAGNNRREWADRNIRQSELLHSFGPATIVSSTEMIQPRFIYVSSCYVYDGMKGNYHENDAVLPSTVIGKMKLSGENIIKSKSLNYIILRSSPTLGRGNGVNLSFMDRLRMSLERNRRFEATPLEIHSFAPSTGLCELLRKLVESGVRNRVLHYGGLTKLTTYDLAVEFAKQFKYDPNLIVPKGLILRKPGIPEDHVFDFSLNSTQTIEALKIKPFFLEESFDLIKKQLVPQF